MRESTIEKRVSDYAATLGWKSYKWSSQNRRGVPDRIFLRKGHILFVEFKAQGLKPTKLQKTYLQMLVSYGFHACVIDNVEDGKALFNNAHTGLVSYKGLQPFRFSDECETKNFTADTVVDKVN
jgi:hypothetical protein